MLLALAVPALVGACTGADIGAEYVEVSEAESELLFYGPGLAGGYRQFLTGQDQHFVRRTIATYGPQHGEFPFARIYLSETPPLRHFTRAPPVEKTIEQWGWFKNKTIKVGARDDTANTIGRIGFVTVTADGVACVVWLQTFGPKESTAVGTRLLNGYYCSGEGQMMPAAEAETIVRLVGHRRYGAVEPPAGWSGSISMPAATPRLVAEILDFGPYVQGETAGKEDQRENVRFVARTDRVSNTLGTAFGVQYVLKGSPEGKRVNVSIIITHPEFAGRSKTEITTRPRIGRPAYAGYRFGKEFERVAGTWTIEILYDGQVLAGQTFKVVAEE